MSVGLTDKAWLDLLNAEKARAEKAEARSNELAIFLDEVHALNAKLIRGRDAADARAAESQEALAAARRECEELKTLLRAVRPLVREEFLGAGAMTERGWEKLLARLDAALAAPADGEEAHGDGTHK